MDIHEVIKKREQGEAMTVDDLACAIDALCDEMDAIEKLEQETHMGAFDDVANITIPDPNGGEASEAFRKKYGQNATAEQEFREQWGWEPHEQVIIKGAFTGVEQELVDNASAALTRNEGSKRKQKMDVRVGTARNKLLQVMIVDWTLSRNGAKVPCVPENIVRLRANYRKPILEQIDEIAQTMDEDEQDDFLPSSNGHSPDDSTMTSPSQSAS